MPKRKELCLLPCQQQELGTYCIDQRGSSTQNIIDINGFKIKLAILQLCNALKFLRMIGRPTMDG